MRIAVDDFGTGYSSLAYLRQFPVDCIKIDREFTNAISTSPESKALIGTLVQLGKDLGLSTLAEGVETTGELDILRLQHVTRPKASCCHGRSTRQRSRPNSSNPPARRHTAAPDSRPTRHSWQSERVRAPKDAFSAVRR